MIMLISSSRGQQGDRAYFVSPLKESLRPMKLSFYLFMNSAENDHISRFEIYKTENGILTERLFLYKERHSDWQLINVILPEGIYSLTIVGVMGIPFESDIGFTGVQISDTNENPPSKRGKILKRYIYSLQYYHLDIYRS